MTNRLCAAMAVVAALSGCAALTGEPDTVLIEHGGATGLSIERTGVLFGSIGFAPRDLSMSAVSVHLRRLDGKDGGKGEGIEIFATNRTENAHWRRPDVDTDGERIWTFSGRVPAGHYEITLFAIRGVDARDTHGINFKPTIPVTVTAGGAVYVGRWQFTPATAPVLPPQVRIPGSNLVLRDLPEEDQLLLLRSHDESPIGKLMIDDVLRDMWDQGGA